MKKIFHIFFKLYMIGLFRLFIIFSLFGTHSKAMRPVHNKDIKFLKFVNGTMTNRLRSPSTPVITCIGKVCDDKLVTCERIGWNGESWKSIKCVDETGGIIQNPRIRCEGVSGPNDQMIRQGSCYIEYQSIHMMDLIGKFVIIYLLFYKSMTVQSFILMVVIFKIVLEQTKFPDRMYIE